MSRDHGWCHRWMWLVVVASAVVVTSCRSYEVVMPETAAGRICVDQCSSRKTLCISDAEMLAQNEASLCESRAERVEHKCERIYVQDKDVERCEVVNGAGSFCPGVVASTGPCEASWRSCVVECGGRVIER